MSLMPVLSALRYLTIAIEDLTKKVDGMQHQINDMQEQWNNEYEVEFGSEEESDETDSVPDSDSEQSVQSAPATFSYKRQRTD